MKTLESFNDDLEEYYHELENIKSSDWKVNDISGKILSGMMLESSDIFSKETMFDSIIKNDKEPQKN